MGLERSLKGRHQLLKLLEGHTGAIQERRGARLQIGEPYTGQRGCLLSWERSMPSIEINLSVKEGEVWEGHGRASDPAATSEAYAPEHSPHP
jgi:hypothetical protein